MTAILAAIVELEAQRERIRTLIVDLRLHARAVEASYDDTPDPTPECTTAPAAQAPRRAVRTSPKGRTPDATSVRDRILAHLGQAHGPTCRADIVTGTALTLGRVAQPLTRLVADGLVVATGHTNTSRYALATGSGAGTRAGSARGSGPRRTVDEASVEIAWNGTKERNGEAPTLTPAREQKR